MKNNQNNKRIKIVSTVFATVALITVPVLTSFATLWVLNSATTITDSVNQPNFNNPDENNNQFTSKIISDILAKNKGGIIRASDLTQLTGIPDNAFTPEIKSKITSIDLPSNIKTIGPNLLKNIPGLTYLDMSKSRLITEFTVDSFAGSSEKLVSLKFPSTSTSVSENFVPPGSTIIFSSLKELQFPYKWVPTGVATSYEGFRTTFPKVEQVVVPQTAKVIIEGIWPTGPVITYIN